MPNFERLQQEVLDLGLVDDVVFAGRRPHQEIALWMGASDWLLVSSVREGWPTVYFEAMACGRPVLTSNVDCAKQAICQGAYGSVIEPRTPEAFASAIITAMRMDYQPELIRACAELNSWARWAEKSMRVFDNVLGIEADSEPAPWCT